MQVLFLNVLLALVWAATLGDVGPPSVVTGFVVGFVALWLARPLFGPTRYFRKLIDVLLLVGFFLWELVLSSLRVVADVLTPRHQSRPGIVLVPLDARTDLEIAVLANLVSLTPGTLSLEVTDDRRALAVHGMFIDDPDALRREIKDGAERRVLEALR